MTLRIASGFTVIRDPFVVVVYGGIRRIPANHVDRLAAVPEPAHSAAGAGLHDQIASPTPAEGRKGGFRSAQRSAPPLRERNNDNKKPQRSRQLSGQKWKKEKEKRKKRLQQNWTELQTTAGGKKKQNKTCQLVRQRRDKTSRLTAAAERRGPVRTRRTSCGCFWHRRPPPESGRGCIVSPGGRCRPKTRLMCQHIIIV